MKSELVQSKRHTSKPASTSSSDRKESESDKPNCSTEKAEASSTTSNHSIPPNKSIRTNSTTLQEIVEITAFDYFVDPTILPPTHPLLAKILIGYEGLQRRRDARFAQRDTPSNEASTRVFVEREVSLYDVAT
jgi:hypothetical protein